MVIEKKNTLLTQFFKIKKNNKVSFVSYRKLKDRIIELHTKDSLYALKFQIQLYIRGTGDI